MKRNGRHLSEYNSSHLHLTTKNLADSFFPFGQWIDNTRKSFTILFVLFAPKYYITPDSVTLKP